MPFSLRQTTTFEKLERYQRYALLRWRIYRYKLLGEMMAILRHDIMAQHAAPAGFSFLFIGEGLQTIIFAYREERHMTGWSGAVWVGVVVGAGKG